LGDSTAAASGKHNAVRKVADGPVLPVLGASVGDGVVVPTGKNSSFHPGPIILPLKKIHQMINEGSIKLVASPQNRLAAKKLKGLTQKLSKYGFNIDIKIGKGQ
jgi:hypothetical protein